MGALAAICIFLIVFASSARAETPYRFFDWEVTGGDINPLGVRQKGILINGQFPGPEINCQTNDNLIVNVHNRLLEPFLLSWNGLQHRKNSWQDGVSGTNCPIPPGQNFTYRMQAKDQIGSFFYFPSLAFHKAGGGFGAIRIHSRPGVPVPFDPPADELPMLIGDWHNTNHESLQAMLDSGKQLPSPDGILINGKGPNGVSFTVEEGKTYRMRISNVGLQSTLNFRIHDHNMTLVEVEGTHTVQNAYSSLDVHAGQSLSVLFTANRPAGEYHVVVSTRFAKRALNSTAVLRYAGSSNPVPGPTPEGPANDDFDFSLNQARSIRTNLTASGPRPNPQGSYHYGSINVSRTIRLANSAGRTGGSKQRYAVNGVSFVEADTPLKLADYYNITGVFRLGGIPDAPPARAAAAVRSEPAVMDSDHRSFVEIVFENSEDSVQSWHLDGYSVFVVGMEKGAWSQRSREGYNLVDAVARSTVQVYPRAWTAVLVALDNVGMWNLRSEDWARRYLGQQFYLRVYTPSHSFRDELPIPSNVLHCGRAAHSSRLPLSRS
ncbi:hypothetical protein GUJ93_ZPchr0004g39179 [Zizania palustris]|uniref:Uncharacterized protein n=1 Tax=Zizania palustris TaxID=103762 RepID=A0A8J5SRG5_ZIZPA|nr:hypothetical protein GUJ93_ZPchr0004g39179 [Zizania palustris]